MRWSSGCIFKTAVVCKRIDTQAVILLCSAGTYLRPRSNPPDILGWRNWLQEEGVREIPGPPASVPAERWRRSWPQHCRGLHRRWPGRTKASTSAICRFDLEARRASITHVLCGCRAAFRNGRVGQLTVCGSNKQPILLYGCHVPRAVAEIKTRTVLGILDVGRQRQSLRVASHPCVQILVDETFQACPIASSCCSASSALFPLSRNGSAKQHDDQSSNYDRSHSHGCSLSGNV